MDAGDKVPAELKTEIEGKVKAIRDVLATASVEDLKQETQELSLALQKIGQHMYGQGQPGQPGGPEGPEGPGPQTPPNTGGPDNANPQDTGPVEGEVVE